MIIYKTYMCLRQNIYSVLYRDIINELDLQTLIHLYLLCKLHLNCPSIKVSISRCKNTYTSHKNVGMFHFWVKLVENGNCSCHSDITLFGKSRIFIYNQVIVMYRLHCTLGALCKFTLNWTNFL